MEKLGGKYGLLCYAENVLKNYFILVVWISVAVRGLPPVAASAAALCCGA